MGEIGLGRFEIIYAKEENSWGTPAYPSGSDAILLVSKGTSKQERGKLYSQERKLSYSETFDTVLGKFQPGEFSFTAYIKPSGSLGSEPGGAQLLQGLFGRENVVANTKVEYLLAGYSDSFPSFTIAHREDLLTKWLTGAVINSGEFRIVAGNEDASIFQGTFAGFFQKMLYAGEDTLQQGITPPSSSVVVSNARNFSIGAKIQVGTDNNSGQGYEVTAINYGTNTLTVTPSVSTSQSVGASVKGFLPTPSVSGNLVHGRLGIVQIKEGGGSFADLKILEATIRLENSIKFLDEKDNTDFSFTFVRAGARKVSLEGVKLFMRGDSAKWIYENWNAVQKVVHIPVGNTAGNRARFEFPKLEIKSYPELSGDEEIAVGIAFDVLASSGDDEVKLVFD